MTQLRATETDSPHAKTVVTGIMEQFLAYKKEGDIRILHVQQNDGSVNC